MKSAIRIITLCAFPVHLWTILNMLQDVPAWALRMSVWETIGAVSYTLSYALLESILLSLPLLFIFLLVPIRWRENYGLGLLTLLIIEATITAIIVHFNPNLFLLRRRVLAVFLAVYLSTAVPLLGSMVRWPQIKDYIQGVIEYIQPLTYVYLAFDLAAVIILIFRNIYPG